MFVVHNLKKNLKLGYVHIPRTGGTSFLQAMYKWERDNDYVHIHTIYDHCKIGELPPRDITVSTVRNPWERLLSLYFLLKTHHGRNDRLIVIPPKLVDGEYPDFYSWMQDIEKYKYRYLDLPNYNLTHSPLTTQYDFIRDGKIDYLCRFENYAEDAQKVLDLIGCDVPLGKINTTEHKHYSTYYNEDTKAMVEHFFKEDIDRFGYSFETV